MAALSRGKFDVVRIGCCPSVGGHRKGCENEYDLALDSLSTEVLFSPVDAASLEDAIIARALSLRHFVPNGIETGPNLAMDVLPVGPRDFAHQALDSR